MEENLFIKSVLQMISKQHARHINVLLLVTGEPRRLYRNATYKNYSVLFTYTCLNVNNNPIF